MENFQHASHPLCLFLWLDVQLTGQVLKKLSRLFFMKTYAFLETKNITALSCIGLPNLM